MMADRKVNHVYEGDQKKKKTKFDDVIFYYLNKKAFIYFIF